MFLSPVTALTARGPKVPHSCLQEQEGGGHMPPKPSKLTKKTLVDHFESDKIYSDFNLLSYSAVNRYIFIWNIIKKILYEQFLNNKSDPTFFDNSELKTKVLIINCIQVFLHVPEEMNFLGLLLKVRCQFMINNKGLFIYYVILFQAFLDPHPPSVAACQHLAYPPHPPYGVINGLNFIPS